MQKIFFVILFISVCLGCNKPLLQGSCDIQKTFRLNDKKATIASGLYGTVSSMEGNCMPGIGLSSSCSQCPVKRTVRLYEYTTAANATPSGNSTIFYTNFNTNLIKEVETDEEGFYQLQIAPGKYSIVIVEDGKLYANGSDGQGGLSPVTVTGGKQLFNLTMTYKAYF